jgi:hypothetical protein
MTAIVKCSLLVLALVSTSVSTAQGQAALTKDELAKAVPGSAMERTNANGKIRKWTNNPDGTAVISRLPGAGSKHDVETTTGHWSISEDGRYCLTEEWSTHNGGPVDWCRHIVSAPDGSLQLAQ